MPQPIAPYYCALLVFLQTLLRTIAAQDPPISTDGEAYACAHPRALVKQIDHLPLGAGGTPSALNVAFHELTAGLGLPTAWPWGNYSGSMKGGLAVGDVNVEFGVWQDGHESAIALAPCADGDASIISELRERSLTVNISGRREKVPQNYTGFNFLGLHGPATLFICRYHFDEELRRAVFARKQLLTGGGPLGILAAAEVHADVGRNTLELWRRIVAPRRLKCDAGSCSVSMGAGPALFLHEIGRGDSGMFRLRSAVWLVMSVEQVTQVLQARGLLGQDPVEPKFQNCRVLSLDRFDVKMPAKMIFCPVSEGDHQVSV